MLRPERVASIPAKGVDPMLVLSRKRNESLVIDGIIIVTIVRVAGGKVQIGIEAPPDVHIKRAELLDEPRSCDSRYLATQAG